jgi:histidinol-phosphate/aromatic aminotransferase/cobyric acid decarboxylase-like protein
LGKKGKDMVAYAESKGLIFRPEGEKYGSDGWFRITIGTKEENRMAVEVVREFLTGK